MPLRTLSVAAALIGLPLFAQAQPTLPPDAQSLVIDRALQTSGATESARRPINTDAIVAGLARGTLDLAKVQPGDELPPAKPWTEVTANEGKFAPPGRGGYILARVTSARRRTMVLHAAGHAMVYVNGEPRAGDPYAHGYVTLPVLLVEGENTFLFAHAGRGAMTAELRTPAAAAVILTGDLTLPDAGRDAPTDAPIGVPIANTTDQTLTVTLSADAGLGEATSPPIHLAPLAVCKVPLTIRIPASAAPVACKLSVRRENATLVEHEALLPSPATGSAFKVTYLSRVDGSAQYIAVVPPAPPSSSAPALVLSLHGASVEATNQAASYAPREGVVIACPTNRRPFGFDWEDWGRIDAIESMDFIKAHFSTDPTRQYLTGHSMGGHGTWNIGVLHPERFAALAPSAGWLSFDTYTSRSGPPYAPPGPLGDAFRAARASSDTLTFFPNLRGKGIFILHGDKDDNVPVEQARQARAALDAAGIPYRSHEQPGAGHWWDDDRPGAACLDWPAIWETFAAHTLPAQAAPPAVTPPIDTRGFPVGSFKRAFDRGFVLVYSTGGSPDENRWSLAKARFDAEQWWYRGNGTAPILSDTDFLANPPRGNVVLYGHAQSNRAWAAAVGDKPAVRVERARVVTADRTTTGDDLAALLALPRAGVPDALVGVVAGTGAAGQRAVERLNYFTSGVGFPEFTLIRADAWDAGFDGVLAAGPVSAVVWR